MKGLLLRPDLCTLVFFFSSPFPSLKNGSLLLIKYAIEMGKDDKLKKKKELEILRSVIRAGEGRFCLLTPISRVVEDWAAT